MSTTTHLQTVINHWPDLHALRTSKPHDPWPPASLNHYLRTLEEYDPADRSAPVRLHVIDTIRTVESVLVTCADQTAAQVQRPAMSHAPAHWPAADRKRRNHLADIDAADPRRWRYVGTRTVPQAAMWLLARVHGAPGPFQALTAALQHRVAGVAAEAAERVEHALGITRRAVPLGRDCACGGGLVLEGGDGQPPAIRCSWCQRTFRAAAA